MKYTPVVELFLMPQAQAVLVYVVVQLCALFYGSMAIGDHRLLDTVCSKFWTLSVIQMLICFMFSLDGLKPEFFKGELQNLPSYVKIGRLIWQAFCSSQNCLCMHAQHSSFNLILLELAFEILWLESLHCFNLTTRTFSKLSQKPRIDKSLFCDKNLQISGRENTLKTVFYEYLHAS